MIQVLNDGAQYCCCHLCNASLKVHREDAYDFWVGPSFDRWHLQCPSCGGKTHCDVKKKTRTRINYNLLVDALSYYRQKGYKEIEVPWVVPGYIADLTKPPEGSSHKILTNNGTDHGSFIASAEQGLIDLMLRGCLQENKPYMTVSPCLRLGDTKGPYHFQEFMKLELFSFGYSQSKDHMACARVFMENQLDFLREIRVETYDVSPNQVDLYFRFKGHMVELGSYGRREILYKDKEYTIQYGTGLALPRLSQCIALYEG
ncbi:MAG: hypothetical protein AAGM67_00655 [Bacteroidota bacterium]